MNKIKFPKNFIWGASTASHQVEGNCNNNWTNWEKLNANRLAKKAASRYGDCSPIWPEIKNQAQNPENYISGRACDHYNLYKQDIDILKSLNLNAYRFSLEWSKIEPKEGVFNEKEIQHYMEVIDYLKEKQIEPFVTLWHWTLPVWFAKKGGFENKEAVKIFGSYVEKTVKSLGRDVKFWITLNEPNVFTAQSYFVGRWPPQKKNPFLYKKVMDNLIKAHKIAYKIIKKFNPQAKIGIASHNTYFEAKGLLNQIIKRFSDYWWNFRFLNKIKNSQDFIGLNYYFHKLINRNAGLIFQYAKQGRVEKENDCPISDMGWELYPEGIYHTLMNLKKYQKPIYITEHGLADKNDKWRAWYIEESLKNIYKAIQAGIDARGYFHWSLLDNFEWDSGFWPKFGLLEVDYETQKRKIRKSAKDFAAFIKSTT